MEYRASSVALSQKLSNGHSIYDGVFSSPATKFNVSSFSSSVDDYSEIFGGVGGRRGSLIPVLEVPELHERKASVDVRSSQLDYSKVFSGFGDSDFAVPYEELFGEPKKRNTRTRAESSSLPEEVDPASPEGSRVPSQEASYESFDSAKKFNMSYHKSNHRSKSFTGGTMLHAVPAYTCLVDEVASTPVRMTEGDKPVPSPKENGACFDNNLCERVPEGNNDMKTTRDHLAGGAKVQKSFDRKRSISNVELFSAREIGQGTPPSNRTPVSSPLSEGNVEFEKRMASSFGFSKRNVFEASESVHSPPYFDEEVETSSVAAASAAALMKAIEEAQARINMAKELKERKKGGLQNRGKLNFSNGTLLDVRKGGKFSDIASIPKERKTQELHEEAAAPIKAGIPKERKTRELQDEAVAPVKARIPKERKTQELQGEAAPPVKASMPKERKTREFQEAAGPVKASIPKERKIQEVPKERKTQEFQEAAGPVKASIPKERKIQELNDVVAAPFKFSDIASKSKERTTQKLYEEVVAPVQFTDKASLRKERKIQELLDEVAAPVKFSDEESISKERKAEELHDEVAARVKFPDEACIPKVRKTEELHEEVAAGVKFEDEACIPKVRKTEELNDVVATPFKFSDIASKSKERKTQELYEQVVAPVQFTDKASLHKERKIQELYDEVAASVKFSDEVAASVQFSDEASISKERKAEELHDEVAARVKFADEASILKARKTEELHEEVAARVKFPDEACIPKVRKTEELHEEVAAGVKFEDKAHIPKVRKTEELHEEVAARIKFVDEASILKVRKTEELHEEVAARVKFADEACIPEVRKTEELHAEADACVKFADEASIPKVRKTEESHEEVPALVDVSTGPEQVTAAFEGVGKLFGAKEYGGKIEEKGSKSTETHHRQEEVDASEAGEQFYEFADTDEPDFTEAAEHFYEFSDTSEPDVSEAAELFYEFSDSSEHQATSLEIDEACTVGQFEDEDAQKMKKTTIESFENPDVEGERLQAAEDEENREIEERLNADGGLCKCEENAHELETAQEPFDQKANEKRMEASREHEETGKLKASQVEDIFEEKPVELEKQKGDNKQLETQEFQETSHVKRISMAPDWVEYENIGEEACKHEELEREQKHIHMEEDTEKSFNKDNRQEIMEKALNDFNSKEEYEKRDESKSEGNEKFETTGENEIVLEWDACQKKECEEGLKESFQCVEAEGTHILIDPSTEEENPECNSESANNLCEQGDSEELNIKQEPAGHVEEYIKDVAKNPEVPAHEEVGVTVDITEILVELRENGHQLESFDEDNGMIQKEIHETDALAAGVKVAETEKKVEDTTEIHSSNENGTTVDKNDVSFGQNQDQVAREPEVVCHFEEHVEELGDMNKGTLEAEVAVKQEDKNNAKPSYRKRWFDEIDVSETLIKLKETANQSESGEDENVVEEKEISETDGLVPCVKLAEILKQMEDPIDPHLSESDEINLVRNAMNYGKDQDDQLPRDPIGACNLEKHVEEFEGIQKDPMEPEVSVNQEENKSNSKSSHRKRWFGDGNNTEVAQLSNLLRRKGGNVLLDHEMDTGLCTRERKEIRENFLENQRLEENEENQQTTRTVDTETIDCSLNDLGQEKSEDHQTTSSAEESETSHGSQKNVKEGRKENRQETTAEMCETSDNLQKEVIIEKGCIIQKDNTKGRERERVKERKAVERVIREARERAFVEARERAAETRQRVMAEAQERLGKTSAKANDISLAEKASKEAKLKAERAAVERATAEARDRALEKALSGKSLYETGKQAKRSVSEKFSTASRDDGMKLGVSASDPESKASFPSSTSRYPASSSQGDPCTAERSGGTNGESAQRNKAKMERNERTAERAAKALAEKNMRDLLVQKEQAERNRIAETLDAEVKRWSSGKERNLRAMLSTLQYVLGPDSGWQPIPLTDVVTAVAVKKAYRKAALFVHPDKLQQRGASIQQKYICEKVFDLLKEAWNRFNVDER